MTRKILTIDLPAAADTMPHEARATPRKLRQLGMKIKTDLDRSHRFRDSAVKYAVNAGRKLLQAKDLCDHGKWSSWLQENFALSEGQARRYMQAAKKVDKLGSNHARARFQQLARIANVRRRRWSCDGTSRGRWLKSPVGASWRGCSS
jgi:hypothetical protein